MGELTRNTDILRREVAAHVAADQVAQGFYWDDENRRGCWIGCLSHHRRGAPEIVEAQYGIPEMVQRIAESIFERLPADEAVAFFSAFPDAVGCDGKDLSRVGWRFLHSELQNLPPAGEWQSVINPVVAGIGRLACGLEWDEDAADAAADAAHAANAADAADAAGDAARAAARAAAGAAADAASLASVAARAAARATGAARVASAADLRRQRDLLLRLIADAEVHYD